MKETNYLKEIFKIQEKFQLDYGYVMPVHNWASAIMTEGGELWAISGGKWWKNYLVNTDSIPWGRIAPKDIDEYLNDVEVKNREKIVDESIDILHFLVGAWLKLGLTAEDIFTAYNKKMNINITRQETKY